MNSRMIRMLLFVIAMLLGSGSAFALGAKGDGMGHEEKGMMMDDSSMKKHDEPMMKQETMKDDTMKKEEMKQDDGMMKKDKGMGGADMEEHDSMKDSMK
jgi:hypothetical protein